VTFADSGSEGQGYAIDALVDHPITEGVYGVGIDYQRRITNFGQEVIDLSHGDGPEDFLAAIDGDGQSGNVVFISDTEIFKDPYSQYQDFNINDLDNRQLLTNILKHLVSTSRSVGDVDWFQFTMEGTANSDHSIDVVGSLNGPPMQILLYSGSGELLRESGQDQTDPSISLDGLGSGEYYVRIVSADGNIQPDYTLSIHAPGSGGDRIPPDWAEANDSANQAYPLGLPGPETLYDPLTIHAPGNDDWFQFELAVTGGEENYVAASAFSYDDDIDLELYSFDGTTLLDSSTGDDFEELVSLAGLDPGSYLIRVYGYQDSMSAGYELTINGPGYDGPVTPPGDGPGHPVQPADPDWAEINDTYNEAYDFGGVSGNNLWHYRNNKPLTLHYRSDDTLDTDWFAFETIGTGTGEHFLTFSTDVSTSTSIELFDDQLNPVGQSVDPHGHRISLAGLESGRYLVNVSSDSVIYNYGLIAQLPTQADDPDLPDPDDQWTVMVYMTGSDLNRYAHQDVNELEWALQNGLNDTVNVTVFWDQSSVQTTYPTGNGSQSAWGTAGQAQLVADGDMDVVRTSFDVSMDEVNSGDPAVLTNFVTWSQQQAPAENYLLVMWDHGRGIDGSNFDDRDNQEVDHLSLEEVGSALTALNTPVDIVAYDACLMAMAEVAHALQSTGTNYLVASEELIPVDGFDYRHALNALVDNPMASPAEVAIGITEHYLDIPGVEGWDTLSTTDLTETPAVWTTLSALGDTFANAGMSDSDWTLLQGISQSSLRFSTPAFMDIGDFVQRIQTSVLASRYVGVYQASTDVLSALDRAVLANTHDYFDGEAQGLSIYAPTPPQSWDEYPNTFTSFNSDTNWWNFLTNLYQTRGGNSGQQEPVAIYNFTGNADDSSGNDNHGTVTGALLAEDRFGQANSAYYFDGTDTKDDFIETLYPGPVGTSARTVTFWAKTTESQRQPVIGWGAPVDGQQFLIELDDDDFGGVTVNAYNQSITYEIDGLDDQWHHYAVVLLEEVSPTLADIRVYQDGVMLQSPGNYFNANLPLSTSNENSISIGKYLTDQGSDDVQFDGYLDDIRIYDRALSSDDVFDLTGNYQTGFGYNYQGSGSSFVDPDINSGNFWGSRSRSSGFGTPTSRSSSAEANPLGTLHGAGHQFRNLTLSEGTTENWFSFSIGENAGDSHSVSVLPKTAGLTMAVQLYGEGNPLPLIDSRDAQSPRALSLDGLASGEYYIRTLQTSDIAAGRYDLMIDAPEVELDTNRHDQILKAKDLGVIGHNQMFPGGHYESGETVWMEFVAPRTGVASHRLLHIDVPNATQAVNATLRDGN
ncbi:MAG: clostripain-related cysteine peptidase, partial [Rubripirellula sp.]